MLKRTSAPMSCALAVLGLSAIALAQAPTGIISGTVTDESGAVMPGVTISITNKATGFARAATTNVDGLYSAPSLPAGDYEVRTEHAGFRTLLREATVEAGSSTTVNLQMQLGGTKEVVTVEAATAQVNYDSHTIEGVIEQSTIQELPLNGRSFMQLAALEPGVHDRLRIDRAVQYPVHRQRSRRRQPDRFHGRWR